MQQDLHTHSNYSDGTNLWRMIDGAEAAGLETIGFADHCIVSGRPHMQRSRRNNGFMLDLTYQDRLEAIRRYDEQRDITVLNGVEMDYAPEDEREVRAFLDSHGFDYTYGSVHYIGTTNVHHETEFTDMSTSEREDAVSSYFQDQIALVRSGLFDVAAHPDLVMRNEALQDHTTEDQYERLAAAFAGSTTIAELNGGRVLEDDGRLHPQEPMLDIFIDHGVEMKIGTDSHSRQRLEDTIEWFRSSEAIERVRDHGLLVEEL